MLLVASYLHLESNAIVQTLICLWLFLSYMFIVGNFWCYNIFKFVIRVIRVLVVFSVFVPGAGISRRPVLFLAVFEQVKY